MINLILLLVIFKLTIIFKSIKMKFRLILKSISNKSFKYDMIVKFFQPSYFLF